MSFFVASENYIFKSTLEIINVWIQIFILIPIDSHTYKRIRVELKRMKPDKDGKRRLRNLIHEMFREGNIYNNFLLAGECLQLVSVLIQRFNSNVFLSTNNAWKMDRCKIFLFI